MSENFAQLFEDSISQVKLYSGALVQGEVVEIQTDYVLVNAGLKSESLIPIAQFQNNSGQLEVNIGDKVELAVETVEDGWGETILSRERAKRLEVWINLEKAQAAGQTVNGIITSKVKGGFTVEIDGVRAFLPGSLVDARPMRETTYLEGKELDFKVIKLDKKRNNVVVSRRSIDIDGPERNELLDKMQEGQNVKGIVKNLTDYGAFVDLGGLDGLLHITDMSWKRIKHPSELVGVGDEIDVKILKFDRDRNRVSLGMKQLGDDPWVDIARRYPVGSRLFGKVTNITDYGCFIEIEEGIEGLVHVSEMDWTNKNIHPNKVVTLGDEKEVMVLEVDESRRRISLGIKQCAENPWEAYAGIHQKGELIKGKIKSITDFGIFVGLDGGIDGLVHLSDIAWDSTGEDAIRNYKKGQEIEAVILAIDADRERISLGIKQLDGEGAELGGEHAKGDMVTGKIVEFESKAAIVEISEGVRGLLRASELSAERVTDIRDVLNLGDEIEAIVVGLDKKTRMLNLSIKAKMSDNNADVDGPKLGDLLKEQIADKG